MLQRFQHKLAELQGSSKLLAGHMEHKFLLAVSGGLDSIVLAELFKLSGHKYAIAHCNFGLRGSESEEDLKFVKEWSVKNQVQFYSVNFDTASYCEQRKVSIQMGARDLRYQWLEETRDKYGFDYIVTAHQADDVIETFFINLLRGTGLAGLHGIKEKNGYVIRPLLDVYRKEIEHFANTYNLQCREDSSNHSDDYERNKIRHHLIPELSAINPAGKESVLATIANISNTESVLNELIGDLYARNIVFGNNRIEIETQAIQCFENASGIWYELLKDFGFKYAQCIQLNEAIKGQSGKQFTSLTHRLIIDRNKLIVEEWTELKSEQELKVDEDATELITESNQYVFDKKSGSQLVAFSTEAFIATLDYDKLTFPLKIRKWAAGDKFYPLGMNHPKKVSDFLIDNKVSLPDKEHVRVLVSGNEIAWLIGQRIDSRFKVTEATKNFYICKSLKAPTL